MSARGIPQIAVVMGSCTAGGAYVPAMSDEAIIVKNQGTIFLGGPPLVKAATGEVVTAEALGGASVHSRQSGVTDHLVNNDQEAIEKTKEIVRCLGHIDAQPVDFKASLKPNFDTEDLLYLIPSSDQKGQNLPMKQILARIIDASDFNEFKKEYGQSIICGFARIKGYLVGIVANNGILFSESALKAAHFIQLCDKRKIPLLFFQDIVGFMVGSQYEKRGIAKDGAKMVNAVSTASVPKFTVIMGGSFGAGNYGMCGRAYQPRTMFSWPNSSISVMGPQQAADVLTQVRADSYAAKGKQWDQAQQQEYHSSIKTAYLKQASPYYATARLWDDGIIDPLRTREALAISLAASCSKRWETSPIDGKYGVFRM